MKTVGVINLNGTITGSSNENAISPLSIFQKIHKFYALAELKTINKEKKLSELFVKK